MHVSRFVEPPRGTKIVLNNRVVHEIWVEIRCCTEGRETVRRLVRMHYRREVRKIGIALRL